MYHFETTWDVTAEHTRLQRFHVAAHVGLRVQDVAIVCQFIKDLFLFVGENNVRMESLHHEQSFAQSPRTFTKHLLSYERKKLKMSDHFQCSHSNKHITQTSSGSIGMMVHRAKMKG